MFARTPRLLLRPGWPEDAPALYAAINDPAIIRNLARAPWPYTEQDAAQFLAMPQDPKSPRWLIYQRTAGAPRLIGTCGVDAQNEDEVELGYWIGRQYWGLGYATEAGRAALENACALGHRRVVASHFVDNPASGNVLEKLGFRRTGKIRPRFSKGRNQTVATVEFEKTLDDCSEGDVMRPIAA